MVQNIFGKVKGLINGNKMSAKQAMLKSQMQEKLLQLRKLLVTIDPSCVNASSGEMILKAISVLWDKHPGRSYGAIMLYSSCSESCDLMDGFTKASARYLNVSEQTCRTYDVLLAYVSELFKDTSVYDTGTEWKLGWDVDVLQQNRVLSNAVLSELLIRKQDFTDWAHVVCCLSPLHHHRVRTSNPSYFGMDWTCTEAFVFLQVYHTMAHGVPYVRNKDYDTNLTVLAYIICALTSLETDLRYHIATSTVK